MSDELTTIVRILYWVGCGLSFVSYSVRDILWLRLLAIANCILIIPYYLVIGDMAWEPVLMAGIIALINIINSYVLLRDKRPPKLTAEQENLHKNVFHNMNKRSMLKLLDIAEWVDGKKGDMIFTQGKRNGTIVLLVGTEAKVYDKDTFVSRLRKNRFCGEMTYVTDFLSSPANISLANDGKYIKFNFTDLIIFKHDNPEAYSEFFATLSVELARKISENFNSMAGDNEDKTQVTQFM